MGEPLYKVLGKRTAKVEKISPDILVYEAKAPQDWWLSSVSLESDEFEIGIEMEVENVRLHSCTDYTMWTVHPDGSLRNNGHEYVTHPIKGKRIPFVLNQFFNTMGSGISFSPRTSVHIHLNVLDMTPEQIGGLVMAYLPFEKLLFQFVGGNREKSNFCVPLMDVHWDRLLSHFFDAVYEPQRMDQYRYMALNLAAIQKFGTLEFRHLGGTNDVIKILRWINLIFKLKKYVLANNWGDIKHRISKLNEDSAYTAFFDEVWGNCGWYLNRLNLQKDMELAVSRIKRLTFKNTFRESIIKGCSKESSWYKMTQYREPKSVFEFRPDAPQPRQARRAGPAPRPAAWPPAEMVFGPGQVLFAGGVAPMDGNRWNVPIEDNFLVEEEPPQPVPPVLRGQDDEDRRRALREAEARLRAMRNR